MNLTVVGSNGLKPDILARYCNRRLIGADDSRVRKSAAAGCQDGDVAIKAAITNTTSGG